jgi:hypothetical protein
MVFVGVCVPLGLNAADDEPKAALQALNDYVGTWKGDGGPDKPRPDPRDPTWRETITWEWKFRGGEGWLSFRVTGGKHLTGGEVRYLPGKKVYELTSTGANGEGRVFEGKLDSKGYLTFERTEPATGEAQQLVMNLAGDGARFVYRYAARPKGRTVFTKLYQVAASKDGESLGAAGKKNECVVTGGLGTIAVQFMGETFYVCCSGCRDEFNIDPAKYVREFREKKGKK